MKAEHRKELQTNALADHLGRFIQNIGTNPGPLAWYLLGAVVLVIALYYGWRYFSTTSAKGRSTQWVLLDEATNTDDLNRIIQDHPGSSAARTARFLKARKLMQEGQSQLYYPLGRTQALANIDEAGQLYQKLVDESKDMPVLAQEALMGTATAHVIKGEYDQAIAAYKDLAKRYPKSFQGEQAEKLAKQLEDNGSAIRTLEDRLATLAGGGKAPGS
jgi:hypothetical protein